MHAINKINEPINNHQERKTTYLITEVSFEINSVFEKEANIHCDLPDDSPMHLILTTTLSSVKCNK